MSSFPSFSSLEPPPLDSTSEDEDSSEFRTPAALKLDLLSADPSPLSTPRRSSNKPVSPLSLSLPSTENGHNSDTDSAGGGGHWDLEREDICEEEDEDFKDCINQEGGDKEYSTRTSTSTSTDAKDIEVSPKGDGGVDELKEEEGRETKSQQNGECDDVHRDDNKIEEEGTERSRSRLTEVEDVEVKDEGEEDDFQDFATPGKVVEGDVQTEPVPLEGGETLESEEDDGDDFGGFAAFQTSGCDLTPPPPPVVVAEGDDDNQRVDSIPPVLDPQEAEEEDEDEDDDFGDFSTPSFQSAPAPPPMTTSDPRPVLLDPGGGGAKDDDNDDFEDFANFQEAPSTSTNSQQPPPPFYSPTITSPRSSTDFTAALQSRFDTLIKSVIPGSRSNFDPEEEEIDPEPSPEQVTCTLTLLERELSETKDCCWGHIVDFEESRALLHKWPHSSSQQRFYTSLKIDTSTIVYTEKWGAIEVPRCAAGMVERPILQPQVISSTSTSTTLGHADEGTESPQPPRKNSSSTQEDNPVAVIPNGKPQQQSHPQLSLEAQRIIQKIPDISYMTSKTFVFPQGAGAGGASSSRSNSLL